MNAISDPYWASSTRFYAIETPDGEQLVPESTANIFPGLSNVVTGIPFSVLTLLTLIKNWKIGDTAAYRESFAKLSVYLTTFFHSVAQSFSAIVDFLNSNLTQAASCLKSPITIVGYVICAIEFVLESVKLVRQALFQSQLMDINLAPTIAKQTKKDIDKFIKNAEKLLIKLPEDYQALIKGKLEDLKNETKTLDQFEQAQELGKQFKQALCLRNLKVIQNQYFKLSDSEVRKIVSKSSCTAEQTSKEKELLKIKSLELSRRIQPWLYNEFVSNQSSCIEALEKSLSGSQIDQEELQKAIKLNEQVNKQSKKAIIIHCIALAAIGIAIASIVAFSHGIGLIAACVLFAAATTGSVGTGLLKSCVLPSEGYDFHLGWVLPMFIRKKYHL